MNCKRWIIMWFSSVANRHVIRSMCTCGSVVAYHVIHSRHVTWSNRGMLSRDWSSRDLDMCHVIRIWWRITWSIDGVPRDPLVMFHVICWWCITWSTSDLPRDPSMVCHITTRVPVWLWQPLGTRIGCQYICVHSASNLENYHSSFPYPSGAENFS